MKTLHREAGGGGVATGCCILPKFLENRMELKENENKMERGDPSTAPKSATDYLIYVYSCFRRK